MTCAEECFPLLTTGSRCRDMGSRCYRCWLLSKLSPEFLSSGTTSCRPHVYMGAWAGFACISNSGPSGRRWGIGKQYPASTKADAGFGVSNQAWPMASFPSGSKDWLDGNMDRVSRFGAQRAEWSGTIGRRNGSTDRGQRRRFVGVDGCRAATSSIRASGCGSQFSCPGAGGAGGMESSLPTEPSKRRRKSGIVCSSPSAQSKILWPCGLEGIGAKCGDVLLRFSPDVPQIYRIRSMEICAAYASGQCQTPFGNFRGFPH